MFKNMQHSCAWGIRPLLPLLSKLLADTHEVSDWSLRYCCKKPRSLHNGSSWQQQPKLLPVSPLPFQTLMSASHWWSLLSHPSCIIVLLLTNKHHRLRGLKQHIFIISVSVDQESGKDLARSFAQGLTRLQAGCWGVTFSSEASKLPNVVGRVHFLAAIELTVVYFLKAKRESKSEPAWRLIYGEYREIATLHSNELT